MVFNATSDNVMIGSKPFQRFHWFKSPDRELGSCGFQSGLSHHEVLACAVIVTLASFLVLNAQATPDVSAGRPLMQMSTREQLVRNFLRKYASLELCLVLCPVAVYSH
jgi:hypothetical protein